MYSTEINGVSTEFGTSGMLYRSNKLMYDRNTETLWHQFRGEPVVGPLAGTGIQLQVIPNTLTTWGEWLEAHPDTTVVSDDTGVYPTEFYRPEWDTRSLYFSYRADPGTMFPVAGIDESLPTKEQVFGLVFGGAARAYARPDLMHAGVLNDRVGSQEVVIVAVQGGGIRAFDRQGLQFEAASDGQLRDGTGNLWHVMEDVLVNAEDNDLILRRLPSRDAYWFGWQSFYPHTELWQP